MIVFFYRETNNLLIFFLSSINYAGVKRPAFADYASLSAAYPPPPDISYAGATTPAPLDYRSTTLTYPHYSYLARLPTPTPPPGLRYFADVTQAPLYIYTTVAAGAPSFVTVGPTNTPVYLGSTPAVPLGQEYLPLAQPAPAREGFDYLGLGKLIHLL